MYRFSLSAVFLLIAFVGCSNLRDTHERLHSVLWAQTSAEHNALITLTYKQAQEALDLALPDKSWTAAVEQDQPYSELPPAIIMDLDETVLDNSPFEGRLIKARMPFDKTKWDQWVEEANAPALPGAVDFIAATQRRGIIIFFVTNRRSQHEPSTRKNLERLGISLRQDIDVVLSEGEQPNNWGPDKTTRRRYLASQFRILLLLGDDLGDFVSGAIDLPQNRIRLAQQHNNRWGVSWFLIPNSIYGSWESSLYEKGLSDKEILHSKRNIIRDQP